MMVLNTGKDGKLLSHTSGMVIKVQAPRTLMLTVNDHGKPASGTCFAEVRYESQSNAGWRGMAIARETIQMDHGKCVLRVYPYATTSSPDDEVPANTSSSQWRTAVRLRVKNESAGTEVVDVVLKDRVTTHSIEMRPQRNLRIQMTDTGKQPMQSAWVYVENGRWHAPAKPDGWYGRRKKWFVQDGIFVWNDCPPKTLRLRAYTKTPQRSGKLSLDATQETGTVILK